MFTLEITLHAYVSNFFSDGESPPSNCGDEIFFGGSEIPAWEMTLHATMIF